MPELKLRPKAISDLHKISDYTFEVWGEEQELAYLARFEQAFQEISQTPLLGRPCDNVVPGFRKYICGQHIIFYRPLESGPEVVRILHQSMDADSHFND